MVEGTNRHGDHRRHPPRRFRAQTVAVIGGDLHPPQSSASSAATVEGTNRRGGSRQSATAVTVQRLNRCGDLWLLPRRFRAQTVAVIGGVIRRDGSGPKPSQWSEAICTRHDSHQHHPPRWLRGQTVAVICDSSCCDGSGPKPSQ